MDRNALKCSDIINKKDLNKLKRLQEYIYGDTIINEDGLTVIIYMLQQRWFEGIECILNDKIYDKIYDESKENKIKYADYIDLKTGKTLALAINIYLDEGDFRYCKLLLDKKHYYAPRIIEWLILHKNYKTDFNLHYIVNTITKNIMEMNEIDENNESDMENVINACLNGRTDELLKSIENESYDNYELMKKCFVAVSEKCGYKYIEIMKIIENKCFCVNLIDEINQSFYNAIINENLELISYLVNLHVFIDKYLRRYIEEDIVVQWHLTKKVQDNRDFVKYGIRAACFKGNTELLSYILRDFEYSVEYLHFDFVPEYLHFVHKYITSNFNLLHDTYIKPEIKACFKGNIKYFNEILSVRFDFVTPKKIKKYISQNNVITYMKGICINANYSKFNDFYEMINGIQTMKLHELMGKLFISVCKNTTNIKDSVNIIRKIFEYYKKKDPDQKLVIPIKYICNGFNTLCKNNNLNVAIVIIRLSKHIFNTRNEQKEFIYHVLISANKYNKFDIIKYLLHIYKSTNNYLIHYLLYNGLTINKLFAIHCYSNCYNLDLSKTKISNKILYEITIKYNFIITELEKHNIVKNVSNIILFYF